MIKFGRWLAHAFYSPTSMWEWEMQNGTYSFHRALVCEPRRKAWGFVLLYTYKDGDGTYGIEAYFDDGQIIPGEGIEPVEAHPVPTIEYPYPDVETNDKTGDWYAAFKKFVGKPPTHR